MRRATLELTVGALFVLCSGCSSSLFRSGAYDSQACVEDAIRRSPDNPDTVQAAVVMGAACREGDPAACSVHALMLELGAGIPEDRGAARGLFRQACGAGNQRACANLSRLELSFVTDPSAIAVAVDRLLVACDQGEPTACAEAAAAVDARTDRDPAKTRSLFEQACQRGQTKACFDLAELSPTEERSDPALLELYVRACVGGHEPACVRLGGGRQAVAVRDQNLR